jgi:hypothetical protein
LENAAKFAAEIDALLRGWFRYQPREGIFDWNPVPVARTDRVEPASFAELRIGSRDAAVVVSADFLLAAGDDYAKLSSLTRIMAVGGRCLDRAYCSSWVFAPESVWYNGSISNQKAAPLSIAYGPVSLLPVPPGFFALYDGAVHADAFHRPLEDAIGVGAVAAPSGEVARRAAALREALRSGVLLS